MSRRFSDQPINVIRRIPTPEQLSAARPAQRPFGQALLEAGAACVRRAAEAVARIIRSGPSGSQSLGESPLSAERHSEPESERLIDDRHDRGTSATVPQPTAAAASVSREREVLGTAPASAVQPEEIAELRAFLLSQQQDIARLSAQIHELKSLVVSQQQVLVYLGKEWELSSLSSTTTGVASAPGKRNRPAREKPVKDKAAARGQSAASTSLSL
jgi:hypothetical protein